MRSASNSLGIEDKKEAIFRLLDEIDKVGEDAVKKEISDVIGNEKTHYSLPKANSKILV